MANLLEIAELAWKQLFPSATDETAITKEEFITTAKTQYPLQMWVHARNTKNEDGEFEVPSNILVQSKPLPVKDNRIDISGLKIMRGLPNETWIQNIGGLTCKCKYVKSTVNRSQIFEDIEDGLPDDTKTYLLLGEEIVFPKGTHATELPIIYASNGIENDGTYEVDDVVGALIQQQLILIYTNKIGKEDKNNDGKSEQPQ